MSTSSRHSSSSRSGGGSKKTLGGQFKIQLSSLIDTLNETEPHFVRCMKSNMEKVGGKFDSRVMLTQLRYSGLIEVCRIRQNGFPNRILFDRFLSSYWMLNSAAKTAPELVRALEQEEYMTRDEYFIGHTKIFLKYETGLMLEQARTWAVGNCAVRFQRIARGWMARRRLKKIKKALVTLKRAIATRDIAILQDAVSTASTFLPNKGNHIELVRDAVSTLNRMEEENHACALLEAALNARDVDLLENAVKHARAMKPPLASPLVRDAMNTLKEVKSNIHSMVSDYNFTTAQGRSSPPPPQRHSPPPPTHKTSPVPPSHKTSPSPPSHKTSPAPSTHRRFAPQPPTTSTAPPPPPPPPLPPVEPTHDVKRGRSPPPTRSLSPTPPAALNRPFVRQLSSQPPVSVAARIKALQAEACVQANPSGRPAATRPPPPPPKQRMMRRQDSRSVSPPHSAPMRPPPPPPRCITPPPAIESAPFLEEYAAPLPPTKGVRTSILTRQLSKEEYNDLTALQEAMESLVEASRQEEGITEDDVHFLERSLAVHSSAGVTEHVSHLMMAKEELSRAKKQLSLQTSLWTLTDATPTWKVKNLMHQATQIGMDNYGGVKFAAELVATREKKQARTNY